MTRVRFRGAFLAIGLALLSACSQPKPTAEEKVLANIFTNFVAAQAYDETCNGGKITTVPPQKDKNIYWYGNQQVLAALMAAPLKRRHPKDTVEEGVKRLLNARDRIAARSRALLARQGCASAEAAHMGKALQMFVMLPPWQLQGMIAGEVKKQGGTMTRLTDEENRVPAVEK
jgi:hypothetical protein